MVDALLREGRRHILDFHRQCGSVAGHAGGIGQSGERGQRNAESRRGSGVAAFLQMVPTGKSPDGHHDDKQNKYDAAHHSKVVNARYETDLSAFSANRISGEFARGTNPNAR